MHIPPGFLKPEVWIPMTGVTAAGVGYALKKTGATIDERRTPVMGVMAAFIFAAQMVNFPVAGGTSGHLIGSALATAIFGVRPSVVIMASVLLIQGLLFQDGGLDALGANIFNMGVWGCLVSGAVIAIGRKLGSRVFFPSVAFGAWLSVVGAAALCAAQLGLSGTSPLAIVLPAMMSIHAIIGVFEGIITVLALRFIYAVNPGIRQLEPEAQL
ncbi:MAG: energy-coupling factor ABC transporter permease [Candidatus Latescibacterota bacterium]